MDIMSDCVRFGDNNRVLFFYVSSITNVDGWKAFVAEHSGNSDPIRVEYVLEAPTETALTAEELAAYATLRSNYPSTTVLNDGGAGMTVAYVADTKLYIDRKLSV